MNDRHNLSGAERKGMMKLKYTTSSRYYRIRCKETSEEKDFGSEAECVEWALKVAHTFQRDMTFAVIEVAEKSAGIAVEYATAKLSQKD
jgi:hypothetical protein